MFNANKRHLRRTFIASSALTAVVLLAGHGAAWAAAAPAGSTVEEVTVTAQRRAENVQTVPIAIQAFTAKSINDLGIKASSDLAQITPNVDIALPNGSGNQPLITIRGIGLNDYDSNNAGPNGIYIDEVYLSSPGSQTFQVFDLQRIEVLKGPQGTLYGRNASGGAINFISVKPTDQFTTHLHAEYSSFNTVNLEGAVGGPIAPNLDARVAAVYNHSDGYMVNHFTGNHETGANNYGARIQLLWKPTDNFSALLSVHGGQVDNRPTEYRHLGVFEPGSFDPNTFNFTYCPTAKAFAGHCTDAVGYGTNSGFYDGGWQRQQHLKVNNLGASLRMDYNLGSVKLTSITAYEHNDKLHPEDSDAAPFSIVEVDYGVRTNTITQELRASQSAPRYEWVAGAYFLNEDLRQNQPLYLFLDWDKFWGPGAGDNLAEKGYDHSKQETTAYAIYAQGDYKFTDQLKLTVGGRYTTEHKTFATTTSGQFQDGGYGHFGPITQFWSFSGLSQTNSAFNFRVALNYQFTHDLMGYASVTTGFKSGDFNGGFLSTDPIQALRQLAPVRPETVTAYEVGFKSTWFDNRLLLDVAGFYNDYKDEQVFVEILPTPGSGITAPLNVLDNAPKAHTAGIDAELIAKPFQGLTLTTDFGLLDARIDRFSSDRTSVQTDYTGNNLPLAPKFTFSGIFDYRHPLGAGTVDFQFSANYRSVQHDDLANSPFTTQQPYWIENLRVAYAFDHDRMEVAAFIHNLSNQQTIYAYDLSNPFGIIEQVIGAPRSFGVSLDYRY
jgi:iron complex outermembrane receptor protein